jgi:hypothetical protein
MKSNEFTTKTDAQLSEAQRGFVSQVDKMSLALDGQGRLVLLTQNQVKAWANKFSPYKGAGVSNGAAATVTEVPASTAKNQSPPVLETSKERLEAVGETPPVAAGARAVWNAVVDLSNNATYEAVTERCLQDAAFNGKSDAAGRVKWTIEDLMKRGLIRLT